MGFDQIWVAEHHFTRYGSVPSTLTFAAYVAARTKRIRIGTAVVLLPFWNPLLVAEEAAMVDILSDGRLDLGVGRGYQWHEYQRFNIPMEESRGRFTESLEIIKKAWTEKAFDYEGQYFQLNGVNVLPKPLQKPHP
ncbi:MAG: LLM class flavin-dependent oxidoreductase, partial [Chloroflexi bacterium]|nr:LLM class flavin-dependent oxidoreductase [Chloroflexota bacterium]